MARKKAKAKTKRRKTKVVRRKRGRKLTGMSAGR